MKRRAILEVLTPHAGALHHMPGGFAYASRMLSDSGVDNLTRRAADTGDEVQWLRRCVSYLERRFKHWLVVRFITPMSPVGLFRVARYRIRAYPTFIMGNETYSGQNLVELETFIRRQAGLAAGRGQNSA